MSQRNKRFWIPNVPEGKIEGYLYARGVKRNAHYFLLADPLEDKIYRFSLKKFMDHLVDEYMGELVCIERQDKKITFSVGGCSDGEGSEKVS